MSVTHKYIRPGRLARRKRSRDIWRIPGPDRHRQSILLPHGNRGIAFHVSASKPAFLRDATVLDPTTVASSTARAVAGGDDGEQDPGAAAWTAALARSAAFRRS